MFRMSNVSVEGTFFHHKMIREPNVAIFAVVMTVYFAMEIYSFLIRINPYSSRFYMTKIYTVQIKI